MMFSERVKMEDITTWLGRYCSVLTGSEVKDIDGVKTGERRFQVRLHRVGEEIQHLTNTIQLGAYRGSVFYFGQPKECRRCRSKEHLAAQCTADICKICKSTDHLTSQCSTAPVCNLCQSKNHRFKDCPRAYANRVKMTAAQLQTECTITSPPISEQARVVIPAAFAPNMAAATPEPVGNMAAATPEPELVSNDQPLQLAQGRTQKLSASRPLQTYLLLPFECASIGH